MHFQGTWVQLQVPTWQFTAAHNSNALLWPLQAPAHAVLMCTQTPTHTCTHKIEKECWELIWGEIVFPGMSHLIDQPIPNVKHWNHIHQITWNGVRGLYLYMVCVFVCVCVHLTTSARETEAMISEGEGGVQRSQCREERETQALSLC